MAGGKNTEQTFSFEVVSILLAALSSSGATIGAKHFTLMAEIDGSKSESGFEHMFRGVKARAKEIKAQMDNGEIGTGDAALKTPTKATPRGGSKKSTPATAAKSGAKRRKAATEEENGAVDDEEESPTKKVKAEQTDDEEEV